MDQVLYHSGVGTLYAKGIFRKSLKTTTCQSKWAGGMGKDSRSEFSYLRCDPQILQFSSWARSTHHYLFGLDIIFAQAKNFNSACRFGCVGFRKLQSNLAADAGVGIGLLG